MKPPTFGEIADVKLPHMFSHMLLTESGGVEEVQFRSDDVLDQIQFEISKCNEPGRVYEITKRIVDVIVAVITLVLASPLMAAISLMIKLNSPGPIIFKQVRIGQNRRRIQVRNGHLYDRRNGNLKGRPFYIYKFRTMRTDVDNYSWRPKKKGDPRITWSGRIIRRLCLDEIPQMLNVLKGNMSIVGPRPELPQIVQEYNPLEERRLKVKPGITGLWQLKGSRKQRIHDNIHLDLNYIRHRSFLYDFGIMLKTIRFILTFKNI